MLNTQNMCIFFLILLCFLNNAKFKIRKLHTYKYKYKVLNNTPMLRLISSPQPTNTKKDFYIKSQEPGEHINARTGKKIHTNMNSFTVHLKAT